MYEDPTWQAKSSAKAGAKVPLFCFQVRLSVSAPIHPMNPLNPMNPIEPINPTNPINPIDPYESYESSKPKQT